MTRRAPRSARATASWRRLYTVRVARSPSPARLVIALSVAAVLAVFLLYTSLAGGGTPSVSPGELAAKSGEVSLVGRVVVHTFTLLQSRTAQASTTVGGRSASAGGRPGCGRRPRKSTNGTTAAKIHTRRQKLSRNDSASASRWTIS